VFSLLEIGRKIGLGHVADFMALEQSHNRWLPVTVTRFSTLWFIKKVTLTIKKRK